MRKKNNKKIKKYGIGKIICEALLLSLFVAGSYACLIKYDVIPSPRDKYVSKDIEVVENVNIGVGEKFNVNINNDTLKNIEWRSTDEDIAKVNDGIIEGVGIGETYVTLETEEGTKKTIYVYVNSDNMPNRAEELANNTYVIQYVANGGTGTVKTTTCTYGKSCAVSGSVYTKKGYTFIGWTTKKDETNDGYNWTGWSGTWKYKNGQYGISNNKLILYAMWDANSNSANRTTISYNSNGGTGTIPSQICVYGKLCTIQTTKPTRSGYTFAGWATAKEGKAYNWTNWTGTWKFKNGSYGIANNKLVLYARWKKNESKTDTTTGEKFTIKYMPNGASGSEQTQICYKGQSCTIKATSIFKKSGYKNLKWRTTSKASVAGYNWTNWKGTWSFKNGQYGINNNTLTLYATWTPDGSSGSSTANKVTIKYNANGGTGSMANQTCTYGEKCTIKENTFKRSGYKFTKWRTTSSTSVSGYNWTGWSGTWSFSNGKYGIKNNELVLYATWESTGSSTTNDKYTIKYNANGGSGSMPNQTCTSGSKCTIKTCSYSRKDYTFTGWTTNKDGKDDGYKWTSWSGTWSFTNGQKGISNKTLTLYAMWKKQTTTTTTTTTPTVNNGSKIHFIATGSSDAILIESNGHFGLVDTSNPYNDGTKQSMSNSYETVNHVKQYLSKVGVSKLDFLIQTHNHSDHNGGTPEIAKTYVDSNTSFYYRPYSTTLEDSTNPAWDNSGYYTRALNAMKAKTSKIYDVTGKTTSFNLGDFAIKILNAETASSSEMSGGKIIGENKNSLVTLVTYKGKYKTLLAGDLEMEDEPKVASQVGNVEILKIGHHSYSSATSMEFAVKLSPKNIVVTNNSIANETTKVPIGYLQNKKGTSVYVTGKVSDAVVVKYTDSSYNIETSSAKVGALSYTTQGNWAKIDGRYWLYMKNGTPAYNDWIKDGGKWYYLDIKGAMVTGWQEITYNGVNSWYYFDTSGAMVTGWQKLSWSKGTSWFYFNADGTMVKSKTLTISGKSYTFDGNGVCTKGNGC